MCIAACEMFGGTEAQAMPTAVAIEMIHTMSLIHDDLPAMDDDDMRRGSPTNHVVFGDDVAILAGDALLSTSFEHCCAGSTAVDVPPVTIVECVRRLGEAVGAVGLAGGQVMDLECEAKQGVSLEELTWIHTHKTAKLLEVSVATGALLGGANGRDVKQCETFANDIGIAFQVADDILDVTATSRGRAGTPTRARRSPRNIHRRARAPVSAEYPRRGRGVAATRFHGISAWHPRRRRDSSENVRAANVPTGPSGPPASSGRGATAAATWIFRRRVVWTARVERSRRRRGCHVDLPTTGPSGPPASSGRGAAAAATWIFRRRVVAPPRGCHVDIQSRDPDSNVAETSTDGPVRTRFSPKLRQDLQERARSTRARISTVPYRFVPARRSEALGKTAGKDEETDKTTYPKLMGLDGARAEAERLYQEAIDSVVPYGDAAVPLIAIAKYIVERNS